VCTFSEVYKEHCFSVHCFCQKHAGKMIFVASLMLKVLWDSIGTSAVIKIGMVKPQSFIYKPY